MLGLFQSNICSTNKEGLFSLTHYFISGNYVLTCGFVFRTRCPHNPVRDKATRGPSNLSQSRQIQLESFALTDHFSFLHEPWKLTDVLFSNIIYFSSTFHYVLSKCFVLGGGLSSFGIFFCFVAEQSFSWLTMGLWG